MMEFVIIITIIVVIGVFINGFEDYGKNKQRDVISFKKYLELTELPIVTFNQKDKELNFVLDTGANYCVIDKSAEKEIESEDTAQSSKVLGVDGNVTKTKVKRITFTRGKEEFIEEFQVMDMSKTVECYKRKKGVEIHGIIGNSFMRAYKYVLDFDKMIAYRKK